MKIEDLTCLIDTREQTPWTIDQMKSQRASLYTGDYSILGLEEILRIERKSLADFVGCVGRDRKRFDQEIERLKGFRYACVVVEATYADIVAGEWRSKVHPNAVRMSMQSWNRRDIPVHLIGSPEHCAQFAQEYMYSVARGVWRVADILNKAMVNRRFVNYKGLESLGGAY